MNSPTWGHDPSPLPTEQARDGDPSKTLICMVMRFVAFPLVLQHLMACVRNENRSSLGAAVQMPFSFSLEGLSRILCLPVFVCKIKLVENFFQTNVLFLVQLQVLSQPSNSGQHYACDIKSFYRPSPKHKSISALLHSRLGISRLGVLD